MADGDIHADAASGLVRSLRLLARTVVADRQAVPDWRDDLRLFAFTWAAGFVFFLIFLA